MSTPSFELFFFTAPPSSCTQSTMVARWQFLTLISLAVASPPNLRASQNATQEMWTENSTAGNTSRMLWAAPPSVNGYRFMSTTTRYGTNPFTACGLDSWALVKGTDYLAVASAQSMQDGCCRCNRGGGGGKTASLGCGSCGKGRFVRQLPRGFHIWTPESKEIFHKEYKFVVVDICPHTDNGMWCPKRPGQTNTFGVYNHLDFATVPPNFDNFYFQFDTEPCDKEMQSRLARMSNCNL